MAQQESKKARRWLLPFTTGVDLSTIASALRLAGAGGATLVAVSLIALPDERQDQGVRSELIQQSKDFLEALYHKALRLSIPVECHEVSTGNVLESIATQIRDLNCQSIVLASQGEKAILLHPHEMQQLVLRPPASLVLLRFPAQTTLGQPRLAARLFSWVQQLSKRRDFPSSDASSLVSLSKGTSEMIADRQSKKEA